MKEKPLLSICIPTYNRSEYLQKCLEAIVCQEDFDSRVEIVVSDNCSTDNTFAVVAQFIERYSNIHYFRNEENYKDRNFAMSLQRADGLLRKLTNDTIIYKPGALKYMLEKAEQYAEVRPQLYFLSSGCLKNELVTAETTEAYIDLIGINLTWIRSLAIWEDDCEELAVLEHYAKTNLAQVPFLLDNFKKREKAIIIDRPLMDVLDVDKKNLSYGLFKVFHDNFLNFIKPYAEIGEISAECYERLRKKILMDFFTIWMYNITINPDHFILSNEDLTFLLKEAYGEEPYYKDYKNNLRRMIVKTKLREIYVKHARKRQ